MSIQIREKNKVVILDVEGAIDINSSDIIETVADLIRTNKHSIIINLKNVNRIDYSGLSALAIAYKNAVNHSGKIKFLNASGAFIELFKIVKLDLVFEFYDDENSAIESFINTDVEHLQLRRRFKRLDIHIPVKYRKADNADKYVEGRAINLSAAGIYIFSDEIFPLGSKLFVEFDIIHLKKPLGMLGTVMWLADKELQPHYYPGMGVVFTGGEPAKEKVLIRFIDKNISHRSEPE